MDDIALEKMAKQAETEARKHFSRRLRNIDDFRYDEVQEKYWDITTGTLLGGKSIDGAIPKDRWPTYTNEKDKVVPIRPSVAINDILTGLTVETSTWWPGKPQFLENVVVTNRGAIQKKGAATYNTYVAPDHERLKKARLPKPDPWINHVKKLFPDPLEHEHFFDFAAHMIQNPGEKINHGMVIAGAQGIGKDTAMHPLRHGVGPWNATEIEPDAVTEPYNGYVQAVMLIINEVRPHAEDYKASNFYNQLKPLLAAPPDMISMNLKYHNTIHVRNLCHVFLTTNEPLTMYIPREDRRLFVMTSPLPDPKLSDVFGEGYFDKIWTWLLGKGTDSVIKWLLNRNIFEFNSAAPPAITSGKQAIIDSANQVRRTAIDDLFEFYSDSQFCGKQPKVIFGKDFLDFINSTNYFDDTETIRKLLNAKNFHFKMDERGYNMVKNPYGHEWKSPNFRSRAAFVAKEVPVAEQVGLVMKELAKRPLAFDQG